MLGGGGLVEGVWHVLASLRVHTYIIHKSTKQRDCNKAPFLMMMIFIPFHVMITHA